MFDHLRHFWEKVFKPKPELMAFPEVFDHFQALLKDHQTAMEMIADLAEKSGGDYIFDRKYLVDALHEIKALLLKIVKGLNFITGNRCPDLYPTLDRIFMPLEAELRGRLSLSEEMPLVASLDALPLDKPELTGGKANTLAEVRRRLHLPVPNGFVITTRAYRRFLECNQLEDRLATVLESWSAGRLGDRQASRQIQYSILASVVCPDVARVVKRQLESSLENWAVRSSAYGEGGDLTFAGLHESFLNVPASDLLETYKKVLASLYSPEALSYRRQMGMLGEEAAMAVLCQAMVNSLVSGVVHTLNLEEPASDNLVIYASPGLGRTVVEGRANIDRFVVARSPSHAIQHIEVASKETLIRAAAAEGEKEAAISLEERDKPCISEDDLQTLASWALTLERYFKRPQEIEWAQDSKGQIWILQTRRLTLPPAAAALAPNVCESCALYPVLIQGQGTVAHAGIGCGPVYQIQTNEDLQEFPEGAILVSRYTAPWLAPIVPRAAAIISARGSAAGHLATIAREFRVPALVGVAQATELLKPGMEITVDTHRRVVYAGKVKELLQYELVQATVFEDTPEFRLLRRLLRRIAPLTLIDPQAPDFTPQACKSVHDVLRYVHEKAVQELLDLPRFLKRFRGAKIWTLLSEVPIGLKILDLGGGIDPAVRGQQVKVEHLRSLPLRALWEGVEAPGVWSTEPVQVDFKGLLSSLTKTSTSEFAGYNLAVVTETYLNLHLRLGYHFNLIDARMDPDPHHNHIYFRFVGGATDISRRSRRARLLEQILTGYHFKVDTKGDLVVARILHLPQDEMRGRLRVLGELIGFTRQLDIQLRSDEDIPQFVQTFAGRHPHGEAAKTTGG